MKNYYLVLFAICIAHFTQAQIVTIPDANFKAALITAGVDTNTDGEIQESEAAAVINLNLNSKNISSLTGLAYFVGILDLSCSSNQLTSLDVSANTAMTYLGAANNQLSSLDLSTNTALGILNVTNNQLTSLDVRSNTALTRLYGFGNQLTSIDVSQNPGLTHLNATNNQLTSLNIKNGSTIQTDITFNFSGNPNLAFICTDDDELEQVQIKLDAYGNTNYTINTYCTFTPGGTFYEVSGKAILDTNLNGCDLGDSGYPYARYNITDGITSVTFISNSLQNYYIPMQSGAYTITPQIENPTYFSVSPTSVNLSFPADTSPYSQDFCIIPNGTFNDLGIVLIPLTGARPGFNSDYQLFYKNKGTTILSGTIDFNFNDDVLNVVSATPSAATQSTGLLSWDYTNLQPFETGVINITLNINPPTDPNFPVNGGDVLDMTATINPIAGDETPLDNVSELHQTVVNSYDPNDKTCLEGKTISPSEVGEYVHYVIRFENTGSASAVNIVVKDIIDIAMYDVSTLLPLHGSHEYVTRIKNTNEVEFIFENINLPFDDANNDGFVAFKIKTQPTLVVNDTFENEAEIYFDYNFPIITDKEITTVMTPLGVSEYILDSSLKIHPNPGKDFIKISGDNNLENIMLYDINGRLLQEVKILGNQLEKELSLEQLASGIYLIKVQSDKGVLLEKLVKK